MCVCVFVFAPTENVLKFHTPKVFDKMANANSADLDQTAPEEAV